MPVEFPWSTWSTPINPPLVAPPTSCSIVHSTVAPQCFAPHMLTHDREAHAVGDAQTGRVYCGRRPQLTRLGRRIYFGHASKGLLGAAQAFEKLLFVVGGLGISDGMMAWGDRLLQWTGKKRADKYRDVTHSTIGFWTDNGGCCRSARSFGPVRRR